MRHWFVLIAALGVCLSHASGLPRKGTLGIPFRALSAEQQAQMKFGPQEALMVVSDANGLKAGDVVVGVSGKTFKSFAVWNGLVRDKLAQPTVELDVIRDGKKQSVKVQVQPKAVDKTDKYETIYDDVTSSGHRIRTFVTRPSTPGKHPVMFWIQGINASTVDFPLTTPNYLTNVLREFANDGYVTVRVEKPGVGDSEGGPAQLVGWDEEMDIYRQALKSLDRYDFVDRDRVYIFGHSMGGCHAPVVCSEIPVKGIITYGTVSDSWLEWEVKSPRIQGPLGGQKRGDIDRDVRRSLAFYHFLFNEKRSIDWIKQNRPELKEIAEQSSPDGVMLGDRSIRYMQEVNDRNFCDYWAKLGKTRVLALFGETDWISIRDDQVQVAAAVNVANPGMAEFKVVPQSDHIFVKSTSMKDSYDRFGKPGNEPNNAIVGIIRDWIRGVENG